MERLKRSTLSFILLALNALITAVYAAQSRPFFVPTDAILVNCGSSEKSTDEDGRTWVGDQGSKFGPSENTIKAKASSMDPSLPSTIPYSSARLFTEEATYKFALSTTGRHWVRLHFYPSSYDNHDQNDAFFSVRSASYLLLHNFSVAITAQALKEAYVVREFSIYVTSKDLEITFNPQKGHNNSYAFVNGIEVVSMPNLFEPSPTFIGRDSIGFNISSNIALETMSRLNVGGQSISPVNDSNLTRTWYDDSNYLFSAALGVTGSANPGGDHILYDSSKPYIAPEDVYATYRSMGSGSMNLRFNLTWFFTVDAAFNYLVRLHFCELFCTKPNQRAFDIYINNQTAEQGFDVIEAAGGPKRAIYRDYVTNVPAQSGVTYLWVSLHPNSETKPQFYDVILNGLEVFKLNDSLGNLAGPNPLLDLSSEPIPMEHLSRSKSKKVIMALIGSFLGVLVSGSVVCFFVRQRRRMKSSSSRDDMKPSETLPLPCIDGGPTISKSNESIVMSSTGSCGLFAPSMFCRVFSIAEIIKATNNFEESLVLGVGGFGKVYKGQIDGGAQLVALKRRNPLSAQGVYEYRTEIELLSQLRHRNLVSLIGYCEDNWEMCLIYSYMANGPLRDHLYGKRNDMRRIMLSWKQRLEICIGAARGLHYLHSEATQTVIHRDVKSSNILLDENLVAKVSDFGLSKTGLTFHQTHITTVVKGSFGYMDPEYFLRQALTYKSDVYSFGVVLFEVLCGRPAILCSPCGEKVNLTDWALHYYRKGEVEKIIDPYLKGKISEESLHKFGKTAEKCVAEEGIDRPDMGEVLWNLELALQLHQTAMNEKAVEEYNYSMQIPFNSNLPVPPNSSSDDLVMNSSWTDAEISREICDDFDYADTSPPLFSGLPNPHGT